MPPSVCAEGAGTVTAAPDGQLGARLARQLQDVAYVVGARDLDDQGRMLVDLATKDASGVVVGGILWANDFAADLGQRPGNHCHGPRLAPH
jgi:hypothetical protein